MLPKIEALINREYEAQRSEAWLALRGNMLTASDAATAIGVNPYEKPEGLILKKCGDEGVRVHLERGKRISTHHGKHSRPVS